MWHKGLLVAACCALAESGAWGARGGWMGGRYPSTYSRLPAAFSPIRAPQAARLLTKRGSTTVLRVAARPPTEAEAVPPLVANVNKATVEFIKEALHNIYGDRHYAYFHALETIARVPYFAYTSVLHLYETLGWSRRADLMKIHFAESWNEQHHLLIMEALGGHERYVDRLISQHLAFAYFFIASSLYVLYPAMAYNLNEQVERHAFATYDRFLKEEGEQLKALPPPSVAKEYYQTGDLYMFDEFHTNKPLERRRPEINNLFDVFVEIRNDEREHFMTMEAMQKDAQNVVSPNQLAGHLNRAAREAAEEQEKERV